MTQRLSHKPGDFIDRDHQFRVEELLNKGGMGSVYKVINVLTKGEFAVKECDILDDPRGKQMSRQDALNVFVREGGFLEKLKDCPGIPRGFLLAVKQENLRICLKCANEVPDNLQTCHICQEQPTSLFYEPQHIDTRYYIFMDYIKGQDIDKISGAFTYPLDHTQAGQVLRWIKEVGKTISYFHKEDLIHRDIKPQNIRIQNKDNKVYLLDFGLLNVSHPASGTHRRKTANMGTEGYAPPEQVNGNPQKASDIYALSLTLIALLSGLKPDAPHDKENILQQDPKNLITFSSAHTALSNNLALTLKNSLNLRPETRPSIEQWILSLDQGLTQPSHATASSHHSSQTRQQLKSHARSSHDSGTSQPQHSTVSSTPHSSQDRFKKLAYSIIPGALIITFIFIIGSYFFLSEPYKPLKAYARQGTIIYTGPEKGELVRELKAGDKLLIQDTGREDSWLKVISINNNSEKGYVKRSRVDIYE